MGFEKIWAEDTNDAATKALPLSHWDTAFVYDQNEYERDENEDVLGVLQVENGTILVVVADGISKSHDPSATNYEFNSLPVAKAFVQHAMAHAKPFLETGVAFSPAEIHAHAEQAIKQDFLNGALPKGGLVVVSAVLFPDGRIRSHRIGDPEPALSLMDPRRLVVPQEWWPQNLAWELYLDECRKKKTNPASNEAELEKILRAKGMWRNLASYVDTTSHLGDQKTPDYETTLAPNEGLLLASDGLKVHRQLEAIGREVDLLKQDPVHILNAIHTKALTVAHSKDNITGIFLRRPAA